MLTTKDVKIAKKVSKVADAVMLKITVGEKELCLTVYGDHVLLHGTTNVMEISVGYSEQLKITNVDELGRISELAFTGKFIDE